MANLPIPDQPYRRDCHVKKPEFVRGFEEGLPFVRDLASNATSGCGAPESCFLEESRAIKQCLGHGIVPSALYGHDEPTSQRFVTLINAAYFFQLENMSSLFAIAPECDEMNISDQARLRQRVEEWTLKAIEDLLPQEEDDGNT